MFWKYALAWCPMVLIAILNGIAREGLYGKHMPELRAHQVSTAIGTTLFGIYIWGVVRIWRPESGAQALALGGMWVVMTVAFEFVFGHYVAGHPWSRLFHDYNVLAGRVWVFVLIWTGIAPWLFRRLSG